MNDDFNSPVLIANLFDAVKFINSVNNNLNTISKVTLNKLKSSFKIFVNDILGLYEKNHSHSNENKSSQKLKRGCLESIRFLKNRLKSNQV